MKIKPLKLSMLTLALLAPLVSLAGENTARPAASSVPPSRQAKDKVRVAVAQMAINPKELKPGQDTVDALLPWIKRAVAEKADLVVFPEYLLGAFHLPDKLTDKLCAVAKTNNINLIVGGWEYLPGKRIQHPPEPGTYANCPRHQPRWKSRGQTSQDALRRRAELALQLAA